MGKKSRRHRNKKTGHVAASASATATATATANALVSPYSASSGTNPCYHGSSADKFQPDNEYEKAAQEYIEMYHHIVLNILTIQDVRRVQQSTDIQKKYYEDHINLCSDPQFVRFIFAFCTQQYLESNDFKDESRHKVIYILLQLGIQCRYDTDREKMKKYLRDINTERGIIKVLSRETTSHCNCMNEAKDIAKTMDTDARCSGCKLVFLKATLKFCDGCQHARYHDSDCQRNHWFEHQFDCKGSIRAKAKEAKAKEH
ncbi:hypothetical protein FRACYDRAFT_254694 [Fragilariopsis cylindrus CCMP1102]|uniref:MYND-type domain-containing protein n=1 Tax=Fragilariopsis cylindrus CCMP1102 TaxID=635003 RepID=A0A1E7EKD6_9STRA|nr:hypothetical protein FRACYDRAFT_254694 [Fragilariopsis cylindrus CCMP1102]|eukprot:OEU06389.1 hypothetical protein FRACYDRAFT_254694 [Fragilariopsis cylindrus CCMP1102]